MKSPLEYLLSLPRFADKGADAYHPGLERMTVLVAAMGRPHEAYPSVHVGGTNGKGTTASLLAAIGTAGGMCVGLHTSPHLFHVGERMRVDGVPAPIRWLEGAVSTHQDLFDRVKPSFFEATLALSLLYFAEREVDMAVVEVGLGGRLDATNVLHPDTVVITHIALEHTDLLGDTLAAIAREKAGIFKQGVPVLTGVREPEALHVLRAEAAQHGAPLENIWESARVKQEEGEEGHLQLLLETPVRRYEHLAVRLVGSHHIGNVCLAVRAAERTLFAPEEAIRKGLRGVTQLAGLHGRFEVLAREPYIIADVAHNPDALAVTLHQAATLARGAGGRLFVILGILRDKDVVEVARLCQRQGARVFAASLASERALSVETLATILEEQRVPVVGRGTVAEGLQWMAREAVPPDVVIVTGSYLTVAQLEGQIPGMPSERMVM